MLVPWHGSHIRCHETKVERHELSVSIPISGDATVPEPYMQVLNDIMMRTAYMKKCFNDAIPSIITFTYRRYFYAGITLVITTYL